MQCWNVLSTEVCWQQSYSFLSMAIEWGDLHTIIYLLSVDRFLLFTFQVMFFDKAGRMGFGSSLNV